MTKSRFEGHPFDSSVPSLAPAAPESWQARLQRWQKKADELWSSIGLITWWRIVLFDKTMSVGREHLVPHDPDIPETELFLFYCQPCGKPRIDYPHTHKLILRCCVCEEKARGLRNTFIPEAA